MTAYFAEVTELQEAVMPKIHQQQTVLPRLHIHEVTIMKSTALNSHAQINTATFGRHDSEARRKLPDRGRIRKHDVDITRLASM